MAIASLVGCELAKHENFFGALTELPDLSPSIYAAVALHSCQIPALQTTRMLARIQSVLRRVTIPGSSVRGSDFVDPPEEVMLAADAYAELARVGGTSLCSGLSASIASIFKCVAMLSSIFFLFRTVARMLQLH